MAQFLVVTHLGGLPEFKENNIYTLVAKNDGLTLQIGKNDSFVSMKDDLICQTGYVRKTDLGTYLWDEIEAYIGTEEELKERLILSRIALVGPFAVFLKKKSTKVDHFITMSFKGNHGLFKVEPSANSNFEKVKSIIEFHQSQT